MPPLHPLPAICFRLAAASSIQSSPGRAYGRKVSLVPSASLCSSAASAERFEIPALALRFDQVGSSSELVARIVLDDEDRENEGDLAMLAERVVQAESDHSIETDYVLRLIDLSRLEAEHRTVLAEVDGLADHRLLAAGAHAVIWRGEDGAGRAAPSGVFLCRLEAGGQVLTRRLALLQ